MKLQKIGNLVTSKFSRQILTLQKHSPRTLFVIGVVGVVGAAVLASRATMKVGDILDNYEDENEVIDNDLYNASQHNDGAYTLEKATKDKVKLRVATGLDIVKLYAPAVGVGIISVAALTGSHVILSNRNTALTAAYVAVQKGFDKYRERVKAELGDDKDREFRFGKVEKEFVEETETGPVVTSEVIADPNELSVYAKFFDQTCVDWKRNPEYNMLFLKAQQDYMNNLLHARGHLFLNEVYDALGIPRTKAGAVVGWVLGRGDDFVDFGIFSGTERSRAFVNGHEGAIRLDFNVAGVIYDLIEKEGCE